MAQGSQMTRRMSSLDISSSSSGVEKGASALPPFGVTQPQASSGIDEKGAKYQWDEGYDPDWLWFVHGKAYDLRSFVAKHPGGDDALLLVRGRDCTALFESYHPFSDKPKRTLAKYEVKGVPESVLRERVADTGARNWFVGADGKEDPFWRALKQRCRAHLVTHNLDTHMGLGPFLLGLTAIATQLLLYVFGYLRGSWVAAVALGVVSWVVAGTLGHEGMHWGISRHVWVNKAVAYWSISGIANPIVWADQHTYGHHSYTNDFALDPDVHHFEGILRMHMDNPYLPLHHLLFYRLWVYLWWTQTVFGECVLLPLKTLVTGSVQNSTKMVDRSPLHLCLMMLHTVAFFAVLVLAPWRMLGGREAAVLFACYHFTAGFCFGVFSQINHLNEASILAAYKPTSWATQQVETAINFAPNSTFWFIFSGGLNFQIEHHLLPGLSHGVLRRLSPIIRDTCREFNVEFKCVDTFGEVVGLVHEYFEGLARNKVPNRQQYMHVTTSDTSTTKTLMEKAVGEGNRYGQPGFHTMTTGPFKERVGTNRMLPPMPPSPAGDVAARARFIST